MHGGQSRDVRIAAEQMVLSALCQASSNAARKSAFRGLENYQWRDLDHSVVFEALVEIASGRPEIIREQLPTLLTRRGFPDIEWGPLFEPITFSSEQLEAWVRALLESPGADNSMSC